MLLTGVAFAAVVVGLLSNNLAPRSGQYLFGMPAAGLLTYLLGAAALRLLQSVPAASNQDAGNVATPSPDRRR